MEFQIFSNMFLRFRLKRYSIYFLVLLISLQLYVFIMHSSLPKSGSKSNLQAAKYENNHSKQNQEQRHITGRDGAVKSLL